MISPETFTWDRYIGVVGYSIDDVWDFERHRVKPGFVELGRCDASKIPMRQRNGYAILVEDENFERFWFHVEK